MSLKKDILFINRDEDFLKSQGESLRKAGYSVMTALDMRGALSALSSNSIGLIICDNTLRDINGYEFLRFLKNDPLREGIPFVFFVPIADQGKASKAFTLGAADFIVYPLESEAFISRIKEVLSESDHPQIKEEKAGPPIEERRQTKRTYSLPGLHVEVSRDSILWMPCKIKNINRKGMFLETALLGKPGVELYIKVSLPTAEPIVKGRIKHIDFKSYGPSTGIGLEVEDSSQWKEILQYLTSLIRERNSSASEKEADNALSPSRDVEKENKASRVSAQPPGPPETNKEEPYVVRFYHSLIGKQLDNYKIVSFLGAGAMGGVFKGWDIALERTVALKIISYELSAQEAFQNMFIKEARFASKLDHQNIARIYHIGNANQILYFSMEFIDGVTLSELIKKGDNLNTLKGLDYLITICEALDFVSQKNIIHRDLKPANIMINDQGRIKIVDFGVAKLVDVNSKKQKKEALVGSPLYIPPETITGNPPDQRSDIYSLGASYYHALAGMPPFTGNSADEVLLQHVEKELPPLKKRNPKVSGAFSKIIEKMMAKKPEDRYQDYKDIIKDLKAIRSRALNFQKLRNATLIFRVKGK